jgi:DHA2 family multidrug resistance protein
MDQPDLFKPWIKPYKWLIAVLLFILLLTAVIPFGLFALNQQYVIGYFGAQPEDISLSVQLTYTGILAMLTIQFRFLLYFERRSYMLMVILSGIALSMANLFTSDVHTFMLLRLLTGFHCCAMAGSILTLLFAIIPPPATLIVASTVFYGTILGNVVIIGLFFAWVTDHMDWQMIYGYLALFQAMALAIVLLLLNRRAGAKKYPLYQIDWSSFILCLAATIPLAYTLIYGPKYYWFTDPRIRAAAIISFIAFILLFYRQVLLKRPYWHPHVFRIRNFIPGLILLLIYYTVKDSINLVYGYCIGILHWDTRRLMLLGMVNLAGLVITILLSLRMLLTRKMEFRMYFMIGFGMLLLYHLWIYAIMTTDLSFTDLLLPIFFQGAASGFLFVPIILFSVSGLPPYTGYTGIALAAVTRFTASLLSIAGFYLLQLYFSQLNKESFLSHLTLLDDVFTQRIDQYTQLFRSKGFSAGQAAALANANISGALGVQGQLLTIMHVFKTMAALLVVLLVIIAVSPIVERYMRYHDLSIDAPNTTS